MEVVIVRCSPQVWLFCGLKTKNHKIGISCFSAKHAVLRSKIKDWLAQNQNNVSKWSNMSTCGLLFYLIGYYKNPTMHISLYKGTSIVISLKWSLFSPWYGSKNCSLGVKQQSRDRAVGRQCRNLRFFFSTGDWNRLLAIFFGT